MSTTHDENASLERSSFIARLRSRLPIGRKAKDDGALPGKRDPYGKARSMDLSQQPFMSQPALVNRVPRAPDSDDSGISEHACPPAATVGSKRQSVTFQLGRPPGAHIDGLPSSTDAGTTLGLPSAETPRSPQSHISLSPPVLAAIRPSTPITMPPLSTTQETLRDAAAGPTLQPNTRVEMPADATVIPPSPIANAVSRPAEPKFAIDDLPSSSNAPESTSGSIIIPSPVLSASSPAIDAAPATDKSVVPNGTPRKPTRDDVPAILLRRGFTSTTLASPRPVVNPHSDIVEEARDDTTGADAPYPLLPPSLGALPGRPTSYAQLTHGARLSPAITMRAPGIQIPRLPVLPPVDAAAAPRRPNASTRLRSMPTLARMTADEVTEDADVTADHDNAMLEEEEEDEEYEDAHSPSEGEEPSEQARTPGPRLNLASFRQPSRMLSGFGTTAGAADATPRPNRLMDYFSMKAPTERKAKTPAVPGMEPAPADKMPLAKTGAPSEIVPVPSTSSDVPSSSEEESEAPSSPAHTPRQDVFATASARPNITHHASKSMVDLLSPRTERLQALAGPATNPAAALPAVDGESALRRRENDGQPPAHALKRRASLPHWSMATPPPPYPEFGWHQARFRVVPREEEGRERLPGYDTGIHIRAIMPCKMEFTAPGVQARDRKWRRVLCELQGTVFRVYKCPASAVGVGSIASWWERRVGVPDVAIDAPARDAAPGTGGGTVDEAGRIRGASTGVETQLERAPKQGSDTQASATVTTRPAPEPVPVPPPSSMGSRSGSRFFKRRSQVMGDLGRSTLSVNLVSQAAANGRRSSMSTSGRPSMSSSRTSSGSLEEAPVPTSVVPEPVEEDLLRAYTLQNAESGLGSDYAKRKNVIRVRLEGEQFLLQAQDVASVVDWIEALQAATNIALDLDERAMPRGPLFPRRRRRRVRRPDGPGNEANAASSNNAGAAAAGAEGRRG